MTDFSKMSDDEVLRSLSQPAGTSASPDLSKLSNKELIQALANTPKEKSAPTVSVGEDIARATPGALVKGTLADLPGIPADTVNMVDRGWQWLTTKGLELAGVYTPEQAQGARQPLPGLEDNRTRMGLPTSGLLVDAMEKAKGSKFYEPQTSVGKLYEAGVRALPSAVIGAGTAGQRVAQAVVPALVSEGAGQLAHEYAPDWETQARLLSGFGTAGVVAVAQAPRGANVIMADALRGVTPAELETGFQRIDNAAALPGGGVTLTVNDALGQVTNGRTTRLQHLDREVTNNGGAAAERMANVYSRRPGEVQATGEAAVASLAPTPYDAGQAAQRGQEAAQGALARTRQERSAITRPYYRAAEAETVPVDRVQDVIDRLDNMIASAPTPELAEAATDLRSRLTAPTAGPPTPTGLPPTPVPRTSVTELDQIYGQARDDFLGPPVIGETPSQARARRAAGQAIEPLNADLQAASTNLQLGRATHQAVTRNLVQPVENGPIGRISEMDPGARNASAEMGRELASPDVNRYHGMVQQSVRRMVRQDPRAAETLARDYAGDVLNKALTTNQTGPNVYGGAKVFQQLAGDPASMENLRAMITQLPDGHNRWAGFERFLETMQATGSKSPKGSDTAFSMNTRQEMTRPGFTMGLVETGVGTAVGSAVAGGGGAAAGAAAGAKRALGERIDNWRINNSGDRIAWMMTSPEARPLLRQLAGAPPGSNQAIGLSLRLTYLAERAAGEPVQEPAATP